ncbi:hypothetical protein BC940DRAFT_286916 [Gongronella butleri]|nr:hypothetical protein BC940DRAFT_286916 [Gongronella butleri]
MFHQRCFGTRFNVVGLLFVCSALFFLSAFLPNSSVRPSPSAAGGPAAAPPRLANLVPQPPGKHSRFHDLARLRLVYSALGHVRLGYVANRTPDYDTPPLLIIQTCSSAEMHCGTWGQRLLDMMHAYFFSMLTEGSAFAWEITWPLDLNHYFEANPGYMRLPSNHGHQYIRQLGDKGLAHQFARKGKDVMRVDPETDYVQLYKSEQDKSKKVTILETVHWQRDTFAALSSSSTMDRLRGKYRLNELNQSEWFWIMYRLLLNPNPWLADKLAPYASLMGGSVRLGDSVSLREGGNQVQPEIASQWFRVGVRVVDENDVNGSPMDDRQISCLWTRIDQLCRESGKPQCHVFLSATSADLMARVKNLRPATKPAVAAKDGDRASPSLFIHTLADTFPYTTWESTSQEVRTGLFGASEDQLKTAYARPVMDWMILSRMDYLVGLDLDDDIKTAAWAAQVNTDLLSKQTCQFHQLASW